MGSGRLEVDPMPERREADVCIVGASFAGLVAARDLVAAGGGVRDAD